MPGENLRTFFHLHPSATITRVASTSNSIFFTEEGHNWVMIFDGTSVVGVWDMTPDDWWEDGPPCGWG